MNTSKLKSFAPAVRRQLMEAVGRRLDYVLGTDTPDIRQAVTQVTALRREAERNRDALIERVAYTWFNRLAALRFLDARGWHPFKARVLTPATPDETQPELLKLLRSGSLPEELRPHADLQRLNDLLDGRLPTAIAGADPQGEAYRGLILAACRCYHALMPFLFERLDDETELLLPDDLLTATSVAEGFRTEISDDDCSEVEILGWLYQFYISEKKDAVMARKKAVPSEDIPAVTQLFTPHWIVRYLVENSLGRLWLRSRPHSRLREHMPYYVEDPAPSESEQESTDHRSPITDHSPLTVDKPEDIRLLDPACGSGHMLTYAFDLLVKIYEEEGHAPSEIPEKILSHNLFGLEICPRAAQLAQFALVCKAREQSRTAFRRPVQPQVMCLQNVVFEPGEIEAWQSSTDHCSLTTDHLRQLHQFRENTETFGALIQPVLDGKQLAALVAKIGEQAPAGDLLVQNTHRKLRLVLDQAEMLSQRYQVVVANPPYMGGRYMEKILKAWAEAVSPNSKSDTYSLFIERSYNLVVIGGFSSMVTMQSWMFLSSYEAMRKQFLHDRSIVTMAHLGPGGFDNASTMVVQTTAFVFENRVPSKDHKPIFFRLMEIGEEAKRSAMIRREHRYALIAQSDLVNVPGSPIAYWVSEKFGKTFVGSELFSDHVVAKQGLATGDNTRFLRNWQEIQFEDVDFGCESLDDSKLRGSKWVPYSKGGGGRKWYGCNEHVVYWKHGGEEIRNFTDEDGNERSRFRASSYYFKPAITWPLIASEKFSVRFRPPGFVFDIASMSAFCDDEFFYLGQLNSKFSESVLQLINPTLNYQIGDIKRIPFPKVKLGEEARTYVSAAVTLSKSDWDNFETSWDFRDLPLLRTGDWEVEPGQPGGAWKGRTLAESWANYAAYCAAAIRRMQELETENNRLWIDAYGLQDELDPAVPEDEITLARSDKKKDMAAFLSYAVGCMMGRYSLDAPGLILANAGDTVEDYLRVVAEKRAEPRDREQETGVSEESGLTPDPCLLTPEFQPDTDGIIPVLEGEWFEDDIVARTREFLRVTFGEATLHENLRFIEQSLGKPLEKYFLTDFYKDHLQTYKKRPIYWLFQSPKKGFSALVYLHRYTRDTVNTLLNGYLRDYLHKLESRIAHLIQVETTSTVTREKTAARKESDKLKKALKDCQEWERDVILPLAQQRIAIDLDDGVKTNYPKFEGAVQTIPGLAKKED